MGNRVYYGEYSLAYWIELIFQGNIQLPEYQRYFAWEEDRFKVLIESFKNKQFIPPVTIGSYVSTDGNKNYIIDGQQRFTCILLAYLERFPIKNVGTTIVERFVDENDDEQGEDTESENMIEWTFNTLLKKGRNKGDILSKCTSEHYKELNLGLDSSFFTENYLGFSYIVPENTDAISQQRFFSTVFRNINIQGKPLYILESRASLYFLNKELKDWFNPVFSKEIASSKVDASQKTRMDFVRYLSLLSQYKKVKDENKIAYGYARKMEEYYEQYIYSVVNNDNSTMFGQFTDIYNDKKYSAQLDKLKTYIDQLSLNRAYASIIDMDVSLFGLIYMVLLEKKEICLDKKDKLLAELDNAIINIKRDPKHTKTPSFLKHLRVRLKSSIDIYSKYTI